MRLTRLVEIATIALALAGAMPSRAAITARALNEVSLAPALDAALPLELPLQDEAGTTLPLRAWLDARPSIWVLADYTCETLCGPMISIVSDALAHGGLQPGRDFRLVVVGLDPKDTAADARAMKQAQLNRDLVATTHLLRGDAAAVTELTAALGFRSTYDRDHDQFAHPAAAFVITPEGGLASTLSGLAIDPTTLRLALLDAGRGKIGTWTDHVRLLCYGYDPATGTYTVAIGRLLAAAAAATIAILVLLIAVLLQRERLAERRRSAPAIVLPPQMPTPG